MAHIIRKVKKSLQNITAVIKLSSSNEKEYLQQLWNTAYCHTLKASQDKTNPQHLAYIAGTLEMFLAHCEKVNLPVANINAVRMTIAELHALCPKPEPIKPEAPKITFRMGPAGAK